MGNDNSITVIRASSLPQYTDCARRSAVRLWPREITGAGFEMAKGAPSIGAVIGTATHTILQTALQRKMDNRPELDMYGMQAMATQEITAATAKGVVWDDTTNRVEVAIKQTTRQAFSAFDKVARWLKPIALEREMMADMGDGFVLKGTIDVLEPEAIDDYKTGNVQRANMAQYGGYSLLVRSNGMSTIERLREIYIPRVGHTKPQPDPIITEYNVTDAEDHAMAVAKRMKADLQTFRSTRDPNAFLPNPNSMMCSPDYCPAWGTEFCKAHKPRPNKGEDEND
jgi:hypothetical protein